MKRNAESPGPTAKPMPCAAIKQPLYTSNYLGQTSAKIDGQATKNHPSDKPCKSLAKNETPQNKCLFVKNPALANIAVETLISVTEVISEYRLPSLSILRPKYGRVII